MVGKKIVLTLVTFILITSICYTIAYARPEKSKYSKVYLKKLDSELLNVEGDTRVIIQFSEKPNNYKNFIKSLNGRVTHDYNFIDAVAVNIEGKKIERLLSMRNIVKIHKDKKVKALLHDSAPIISANDVWSQGITGENVRVCVLDSGVDYRHPAIGNPDCDGFSLDGNTEPHILESPHPYPADYNHTWTITKPGFDQISVHFVEISVEPEFDFIYIKDGDDNIVQTFTGDHNYVWSVSVPGDTIKINLVSDWYLSMYGFYIDEVLNGTVSHSWDDCGNIVDGYNFVDYNHDPMDDRGHGTHVTGIITSNDPYSRGIANGTKIMAAKVLDETGEGWYSDIINGIEWCSDNNAQVMSMSLGGSEFSETCDDDSLAIAVNNAVNEGIPVVVSAGNSGRHGITSPACASGAISVGATDKNNNVVGFSSKGSELDLVAPGYNINSTVPSGWNQKSGTSMAAPHVTGVVALMLEANSSLSSLEIRDIFNQTSDPVNICYECTWLGDDCIDVYGEEISCDWNVTGAGIVNAYEAVAAVNGMTPVNPPQYSDINEPADPSIYSSSASYEFSITWTDDFAVDEVILEFDGTDYTDLVKTGNVYSKVFEGLSARTYNYKWYANDTSDNWNSTDMLDFTINKANSEVNLLLNNIDDDVSISQGDTVNIRADLVSGESIIELYQDDLLIDSGVSTLTDSITYDTVGTYNITTFYPETENYTSSLETHFILVEDTSPPTITISLPQNNSYYYKTYMSYMVDEEVSWVGYSVDESLEIDITENSTWNGTHVLGSETISHLDDGNHSIRVSANDTSNNTNSETVHFFYCLGDIDTDGKIDMRDVASVSRSFGSDSTNSTGTWNPDHDINGDGKIDMRDIAVVAKRFGDTC